MSAISTEPESDMKKVDANSRRSASMELNRRRPCNNFYTSSTAAGRNFALCIALKIGGKACPIFPSNVNRLWLPYA